MFHSANDLQTKEKQRKDKRGYKRKWMNPHAIMMT
jgi:hypothetical protein